jgi:outer membrane protein
MQQTRARFAIGDVTTTDVAQAEARLARARATLLAAESNVFSTRAIYLQVIGAEPGSVVEAAPVDQLLPGAIDLGYAKNLAVTTANFSTDSS